MRRREKTTVLSRHAVDGLPGRAFHLLVLLAAAMVVFVATAASQPRPLAGSEWRPVLIGDGPVPTETKIFVRFGADGRLQGNAGCNGFFGSYRISGDRIEIGPLGATNTACPPPAMEREKSFLESVQSADRFVRERVDLSLMDKNEKLVLKLAQTDAD